MKKILLTFVIVIGMIYNSNSQETIDLFIWAGQSNAQGWKGNAASYPDDPEGLDSQIRLNYTFIGSTASDGWETMQAQDGRYTLGHFGPEVTFSRALKKAGYNPAIFKYTKGATNLNNNWKTPGSGGFYDNMVAKLATAISELENEGHTVNIKGFIWIQGEADAGDDAKAAAYYGNLSSLLNDIRSNVTKNNELPIILGVDEQHGGVVNRPAVLNAHQDFAAKDNFIRFTSMHGLVKATNDNTHLSPAGLVIHGQQISETYLSLISGETIASSCTTASSGTSVSSLANSFWGQSYKSNCSGYISEIIFNSATDLSSSLTISIRNGSDCNATLLHSQTINSLADGDNSVIISEELFLDKEHTYFIGITSDSGENWKVRYNPNNQVIGNLRTYSQGEAKNTCNANFVGFDLDFSVIIGENRLSTNNESKLFDEVYIYPNPSSEKVNIHLNSLENVSVKLMNIRGQILYTESKISSLVHMIDLKNVSAGVYIIQVNDKGRQEQYKLIRE